MAASVTLNYELRRTMSLSSHSTPWQGLREKPLISIGEEVGREYGRGGGLLAALVLS